MKKALFNITLFITLSTFSFQENAQGYNTKNKSEDHKVKFSIYGEYGYRVDNLDWSIAGSSGTPNILSELTWDDLETFQTKIGGIIPISKISIDESISGELFLKGYIAQGNIHSGDNQDSDYIGNNRTSEFSRSNNDSDSGNVRDYSLAINYRLPPIPDNNNFFMTPKIGYSLHEQNLVMTNGFQTIDTATPANVGPFSGLNSSYDASWKGPFIGLSLEYYLKDTHQFEISGQFHIVDYYGKANWNLRTDFQHPKSFEHEANGSGINMELKYKFSPLDQLSLSLALSHKRFTTQEGIDRTFFSSGTVTEQQLNSVNWNSTSLTTGIAYNF
jgi:hypothetical protein